MRRKKQTSHQRRITQMTTKVLVTYVSVHGSTQEIAEKVAGVLREQGLETDLQPLRTIRKLEGFRAVVLGAPLYMLHWHKDALHFLTHHRESLAGSLPVAVFASGPSFKGDEAEWQEVRKQLNQELAKFPWFKPLSVEIVGGRFDPAKLRFPYNLIPALRQMPAQDLRDWTAIRAWANSLAVQFQPALAH
jgi:menaquinone-dependent protoporphyrinogen oxidase